jgi:hypothetical protein
MCCHYRADIWAFERAGQPPEGHRWWWRLTNIPSGRASLQNREGNYVHSWDGIRETLKIDHLRV